jgi:hypothetical protein
MGCARNEAPAAALRPANPSDLIVASGRALRAPESGFLEKKEGE